MHVYLYFQDIEIDVCAILNDTTGTLMSCAWKKHNCKIGLIIGKHNQTLTLHITSHMH